MGEENPEGSDVRTDGIGIAVVYELVPPIAEPGVTRSSTWSWPALQSWSAGSGGLSDAGATIEDWSLDLTRGVGMGLAPKGTYSRRHAPARRRETVTEEPRNAKDISRDYKSLDDTAGSTAPDDLGSSGADSGLTAGGMVPASKVEMIVQVAVLEIRVALRPAAPAAAALAATNRPEYMM